MRYLILLGLAGCSELPELPEGFYRPCKQADNGAPRVLIVGDSISMGYSPYVIDKLCSEGYYVQRIVPNGGSTRFTKVNIDSWLGAKRWDLVTFNEGLHDSAAHTGTNAVPIEEYGINLPLIANKILSKSNEVIFFTTTRIPENDPFNSQEDGELYHQKALDSLTGIVPIYDLRSISETIPHLMENAEAQNNVHYSIEGYSILADFVIESIKEQLDF